MGSRFEEVNRTGFGLSLCIDEYHYITCTGRHFRPEFHTDIRYIVGLMWDKCPMLFTSVTMTKSSIYHTSLMLHLKSTVTSSKCYPADMGLDNSSVLIPKIDPLPSKF